MFLKENLNKTMSQLSCTSVASCFQISSSTVHPESLFSLESIECLVLRISPKINILSLLLSWELAV